MAVIDVDRHILSQIAYKERAKKQLLAEIEERYSKFRLLDSEVNALLMHLVSEVIERTVKEAEDIMATMNKQFGS